MGQRQEETIEQVREARGRISEQFGHDSKRLVAHSLELLKQYQDRLPPQNVNGEAQDQKAA